MAPSSVRGAVNHAVAIYFSDASLAAGFVARWSRQRLPEVADGALVIRETIRRHVSLCRCIEPRSQSPVVANVTGPARQKRFQATSTRAALDPIPTHHRTGTASYGR